MAVIAQVQSATTHWLEGPECFDRIAAELSAIMAKKGYSSIKDFKGKLKAYSRDNKPEDPKEVGSATNSGGAPWGLVAALVGLLAAAVAMLVQRK